MVDNTFLPHEVTLIKAIPLSLEDCEDKLFWFRSSNGVYSVKSGYKLIIESEIDGDQGTTSKDLVQVPIGPITRARAKKFKDVLN